MIKDSTFLNDLNQIEIDLTQHKKPFNYFLEDKNATLVENSSFNQFNQKNYEIKPRKFLFQNYFNKLELKNYVSEYESWIGHIVSLDEKKFNAKLFNNLDEDTYEIAEFEIKEVSKEDLEFLKVGAIFYWSVGREFENGQISKKTYLRFRRSIPLESVEFDIIYDESNNLLESFEWQ